MAGSHLCIPRNETVQPPYFQNRNIMFCLPIPTLIYLWEIYVYISRISRSQTHACGHWDWGRAISRKGIHKSDFCCSAVETTDCQIEIEIVHPWQAVSLLDWTPAVSSPGGGGGQHLVLYLHTPIHQEPDCPYWHASLHRSPALIVLLSVNNNYCVQRSNSWT